MYIRQGILYFINIQSHKLFSVVTLLSSQTLDCKWPHGFVSLVDSGPEGANDQCSHTYGRFSPSPSPSLSPPPQNFNPSLKALNPAWMF